MEENKELEQKKEHGFKSGVLTGVLGTAAVVLAAGAVLFAHGNLKVSAGRALFRIVGRGKRSVFRLLYGRRIQGSDGADPGQFLRDRCRSFPG